MIVARDIEVLLVEPDPAEARRAATILKKTRGRTHVTVASSQNEALAHLRREASHYRSPQPSLILLSADSLPARGEELLAKIKEDARLQHIPVVFMSSSETEADVRRAYDLEANCYVHKPLTEEQIGEVLEVTKEFWLSIAKLPVE